MKEQLIIISNNYRRSVSSIFREKIEGTLANYSLPTNKCKLAIMLSARKAVSKKTLHEEHSSKPFGLR